MSRDLPGHIAAALQRAGGPTDSAGVPWDGRDLSGTGNPVHDFDGDDGAADTHYVAAIERLTAGVGSEDEVVSALSQARVFVPIVTELSADATGHHGTVADKEADMALITLQAPDGRRALPIFSSVDTMHRWHAEARPVPVHAPRAALSAVSEEAQLMVMDPGAEFTFVVRRPALWSLAQQKAWTPSYEDPDVVAVLEAAAAAETFIRSVVVQPGPGIASRTASGTVVAGGGSGPELMISLQLVPGLDAAQIQGVTGRLQAGLSANRRFTELVDSLDVRLTE